MDRKNKRLLRAMSQSTSYVTLRGGPAGRAADLRRECPGGRTSNVVEVDRDTLKFKELVRYPYSDPFTVSTVAIQVGRELWVGSARGDRIAIFPLPQSPPSR